MKKVLPKQDQVSPFRNTHQLYFDVEYLFCQALSFLLSNEIEEENVMKNSKQTSKRAASASSSVLRDGRTSAKSKTAAGSALAQRASKKTK